MFKLKLLNPKILCFILVILILTALPAAAEFYQSGLVDFIQGKHQITVPIFSPAREITLTAEADTVLMAAGAADFKLEAGKEYYITQGEIRVQQKAKKSREPEVKDGWGVQIMASSSEENALEYKNQAELDFEVQVVVKKEAELFKVLAGAFNEREKAAEFKQQLQEAGYNGWVREIELQADENESQPEAAEPGENLAAVQSGSQEVGEGLNFYNSEGEKIREAHIFKIKGQFEVNDQKMQGEYQFGPLANSVLFSYKTDLEDLTAHLLQSSFNPGAPEAALKAQAVLYRTALLYQLESQGARLGNMNGLNFGRLSPIYKEAAAATESQVLIRNDKFYYNTDFSFKEIGRPRAGIIPLAQANYEYQEIINYYYERAELAELPELLDSELKFTARIDRGLHFKEIRQMSWAGPRVITVVDYDLSADKLKLKPVLAKEIVPGREDLGELIRKNSALAGVNGGYFHYSGRPLGLLYLNGILVSEPLYKRTSLLIDRNKKLSFAQVDWQGEFEIAELSRSFNLSGVNRSVTAGEVIVFNSYYGARMPALNAGYYDIVVRSGEILGTETESGIETPIPPDGYIIRVGSEKTELINLIPELKGKTAELKYNFSPDLEAKNILHAVGGGPRLLADGEVKITGGEERFQPDILNGRAPRTALGLTEDNHLLMLTIDGRQSTLSIGMTLEETAETLKDLGAVEAMNLDGGASARMVIRGFTMNSPSAERLISNGVIVNKDE
ncbi:stage II sporulation protein [Halanaerobium saccharolyticum]|uniref:Stage II sporulation protein n=1 Tax=Halanaerobium saccharolyticum TaxID=43595 RepID=A0A4R7Z8Y9_9FIRM|nr:phosphodiester glycosidase family protein [Halanaerobium saccharolyticum]RAK09774.1 stage II sporulation protein [Halanaerobium saccharolyticum]TDW07336.1 stage II sporulation protein [Halanaerobium saccharolyticum]TDX61215.1 stage II sporulation protein [Halanaerobium saccharolyticum]